MTCCAAISRPGIGRLRHAPPTARTSLATGRASCCIPMAPPVLCVPGTPPWASAPCLPYGQYQAGGGMSCNSEPSGMRCSNSDGHGFTHLPPGVHPVLIYATPRRTRDLCTPERVDYRSASRRATISPVARGCSAVGSAQPCQGWGRGFESRHPLEGAMASTPAVEWPSGEATACKAVHTGSIPVSTSDFVPARLAQRESASLTRKRSLVQSQYRAPALPQLKAPFTARFRARARYMPNCFGALRRPASSTAVYRSGIAARAICPVPCTWSGAPPGRGM